ncbi:MAG TPA: hypothetical protein VIG80_06735 [Bacillaceae bacterium]
MRKITKERHIQDGKKKLMIGMAVVLSAVFILLHSTPHLALRTHVFFQGYPKAALTSGVMDDAYHNEADQGALERLNAKAYTLTKPPVEKATAGQLRNFSVKKIGFLYFAEYLGDT